MAEDKFSTRFLTIFSLLLIVAAFAFWIAWGVAFGGWNMFDRDYMGVYAIFVALLGFGVFGFLLVRAKNKKAAETKK